MGIGHGTSKGKNSGLFCYQMIGVHAQSPLAASVAKQMPGR
jgi:hypothetical protein